MRRGGKSKTIYYHYDGLGNVVALTNEKGKVIKRYKYSPFGTLVPQGVTSPYLASARERIHKHFPPSRRNTITYTGREYDPDSGLYFYRARYYDSRVGRFTSRDKISQYFYSTSARCPTCGGGVSSIIPSTYLYSPQLLHPYLYAGNNPINYVDPRGLARIGRVSCLLKRSYSFLKCLSEQLLTPGPTGIGPVETLVFCGRCIASKGLDAPACSVCAANLGMDIWYIIDCAKQVGGMPCDKAPPLPCQGG